MFREAHLRRTSQCKCMYICVFVYKFCRGKMWSSEVVSITLSLLFRFMSAPIYMFFNDWHRKAVTHFLVVFKFKDYRPCNLPRVKYIDYFI